MVREGSARMKDNKPLMDWDDLEKIDVTHERYEWNDPKKGSRDESSPASTIAIAIIAAAVILVGGWIGYQEYKERQREREAIAALNYFNQQAQAITEKANRDTARMKAEMAERRLERKLSSERGIDEIREAQLAKMKRAEKKENCRYWTSQLRKSDTVGNRKMVKQYCY